MQRNLIGRAIAGVLVAAALLLVSVSGGAAHADRGAPGSLSASGTPGATAGDVDGRDFLIWQRGGSPTPAHDTHELEKVYFTYQKIQIEH